MKIMNFFQTLTIYYCYSTDYASPAWPIQLRRQDVVEHASRVANLEAARFDASHCGRPDDGDLFLQCQDVKFTSEILRDALCYDAYGADLKSEER